MKTQTKNLILLSLIFGMTACTNAVDPSSSINSEDTGSSNNGNSSLDMTSGDDRTSPTSEISEPSSSDGISSEEISSDDISSDSTEFSTSGSDEFDICNLSPYYADANCATGVSLKKKLHDIIYRTHKDNISYDECDPYIADANEDPDNPNNLILFYTGTSKKKTEYVQGNADPAFWNKEHTYAKSHGSFANMLAGRDLHHLMPTDNGVNNNRGNKDFDDVRDKGGKAVLTYKSYQQTVTVTYASTDPLDKCYSTSDAFEPCDAYKGDVARILFYMAVRYEGSDGGPNLELNDQYNTGSSAPTLGKLSTLRKWHEQDPVDDFERTRNEKIFGFQENRNPFIDHPELVEFLTW